MPPGAGSATVRVLTTNEARLTPVSTTPVRTAGRHRGEGSRPVGKTRNIAARPTDTSTKTASASAPIPVAAGSAPGCAFAPKIA